MFRSWLLLRRAGVPDPISQMIGMKLRKVNVARVADAYARLRASGLQIELAKVETYYLASDGHLMEQLVRAVEWLGSARQPADWFMLSALGLGGIDPEAVVRAGVDPKKVFGNPALSDRFRWRGEGGTR